MSVLESRVKKVPLLPVLNTYQLSAAEVSAPVLCQLTLVNYSDPD